jgi:hypothetical protein
MLAAADSLATKKGGKKGRKAMRKAMEDEEDYPHQVFDVNSLNNEIIRFLDNLGGPKTMALPPMAKYARKITHELAQAYGLKSQSKGKGDDRYTSLIKTTYSGVGVKENKIAKIIRRAGGVFTVSRTSKPHLQGALKPREGDIVGHVSLCFLAM